MYSPISGSNFETSILFVPSNIVTEQTRKVKVINRRIKQVETRIQREVVLEDGKVIQDSGPKVTTKTIEDYDTQEIEESEDTQNASRRSSSPVRKYFFGECPSHYKVRDD